MNRGTAVTYIPEGRLRTLCSVILRHMGYRVHESENLEDLAAVIAVDGVQLLVAEQTVIGEEAVQRACSIKHIECIHVSPDEKIAIVLKLLERRENPRP
jgi:hypothetical protein